MLVLVLDDEELIVRGLISLIDDLKLPDTQTVGFQRPDLALAYLKDHKADLIFVDIRMPQISGITFIETVRRERYDTRIVLLSGYQEFSYAQRAISLRVMEYLIKPIDAEQLKRVLYSVFHETHQLGPQKYREMFTGFSDLDLISAKDCSKALLGIVKYIDDHLLDPALSLTSISDYSGYHPTTISSLFPRELHVTYSRYIHIQKMKKAISLLTSKEESLSISAISDMLGYASDRQFYRVFKDTFGTTPNQFRNKQEDP